jgi:hypothetical protein
VTAYTVDVVSGVVGGVLCQGRVCCSCSVSRGVEGGGLEELFLKLSQRWHCRYQYSDRLVGYQFLLLCICGTVPGYLASVLSFDGEG